MRRRSTDVTIKNASYRKRTGTNIIAVKFQQGTENHCGRDTVIVCQRVCLESMNGMGKHV